MEAEIEGKKHFFMKSFWSQDGWCYGNCIKEQVWKS